MADPGIDVGALSQLSSENLRVVLRKIPGNKDLVIEPRLMKPLDKIAGMNLIKSCGVDRVYKLDGEKPPMSAVAYTRVYLLSPDIAVTKIVLRQLQTSLEPKASGGGLHSVHLIFVPKVLRQAEIILEEAGLWGCRVTCHSYTWEAIPMDYDVLSLEMRDFFVDVYVREDLSLLFTVARAVAGIQSLFGSFPNRTAVGNHACSVLKHLSLMETTSSFGSKTRSEIGHLFVFDRSLDYAACLLSPLTYEAISDETFGITCGSVDLPKTVVNSEKPVKMNLNAKDRIFNRIRNKAIGPDIFTTLSSMAKDLQRTQDKAGQMSITQMKQFIQNNLKDVQNQAKAVRMHIDACEHINKEQGPHYERVTPIENGLLQGMYYKEAVLAVEDMVAQKAPLHSTRLHSRLPLESGYRRHKDCRASTTNIFGAQRCHNNTH